MVSGTGTWTTELLGFASSGIGNKKSSVVRDESLLQLILALFVNILLVVSNETLGNGLTDGIDLRDMTTTRDLNSDINVGKLIKTNNEERLVNLETKNLGFNKGDGDTINLEETLASLNVGNSGSSLLLTEGLKI